MPAYRTDDGRTVFLDTRPTTHVEAELAALRAQIEAEPSLTDARTHFPTVIEAATAGDWDAVERAIVREVINYMSQGTAEGDLTLSGLYEWTGASSNDPSYIHDLSWAERQ